MRNKAEFGTDFSELAEFIGSFKGWDDSVKTPMHIGALIEAAHNVTAKTFDREAALVARTLGFSHMYEWGAAGINDGPDTPTLPPHTQAARLWVHRLTGRGSNRGIDFTYRPSVVDVPLPYDTGTATGVQLPTRRHKFASRAWVTELGLPTVIKPRYAEALFIPLNGLETKTTNPRSLSQGYVMYPHPVTIRDRAGTGKFTSYWFQWWNTAGKASIDESMDKMVNAEAEQIIKVGRGKKVPRYAHGHAMTKTFSLQVSAAKSLAYAQSRANESKLRRFQSDEFADNMAALGGS